MRLKLSNRDFLCLVDVFDKSCQQIRTQVEADKTEDNRYLLMFLAMFEEMHLDYYKRSLKVKKEYAVTFSPYQAIAFHITFADKGDGSAVGNLVQRICDEIYKQTLL